MKKLYAFFTALMLLSASVPVSAEDITIEQSYHDLLYYVNCGDHIRIVSSDRYCQAVAIPEKLDGLPVTELAEGVFSDRKYLKQVLIPETITVIPQNAFNGCIDLTAVALPASLERVEANAFAGCKTGNVLHEDTHIGSVMFYQKLEDVFYKGSSADWDEVYIANGNDLLKSAAMHCEFNRSVTDTPFVFGEDNWNFLNKELGKYYVSDETLENYLSGYGDRAHFELKNYAAAWNHEPNYDGACTGFAAIPFLVNKGLLSPSDLYPGAESISEIPLCDESIEAITYYFIEQTHTPLNQSLIGIVDTAELLEALGNRQSVIIGYVIAWGAHAVIGYGVEYGEWVYNDTTYTGRILTYDSNELESREETYIYFTGDLENPYVPHYQSGCTINQTIINPDVIFYHPGNSISYEPTYTKGCLHENTIPDSEDAAIILKSSALIGAGNEAGLNVGQEFAADVNSDGRYNAQDAALILQYSSAVGSGSFSGTLTEFIEVMH